jgi:hypothetical protein
VQGALACAAAAVLAAASVPAQLVTPSFSLWPGGSSFATRGNLGSGAGELLTAFPSALVRGLEARGCACSFGGMRVTMQASDATVPIPFAWLARRGNDATGPGTALADEVIRVPVTYPAIGPGPTALIMTMSLSTPVPVSCADFLAVGVALPASTPATGSLAVQMATNAGVAAHPQATDLGWEIPAGAAAARHAAPGSLFSVVLFPPVAALEAGNLLPNAAAPTFGLSGSFPDTTLRGAASQGLALRCRAVGGANTQVWVIGGWGFDPQPTSLPGALSGCVFVDRATLIPSVLATGRGDGAPMLIAPPGAGRVPSLRGATLVWQGIVLVPGAGSPHATNAIATVLL